MKTRALMLLVAVGLAAGCSKQSPQPQVASTPTLAAGSTGTLVIGQSGVAPALTLWYVRIESADARPLAESAFPSTPISLTRLLEPGKYRVIGWHRACTKSCPASGEDGLGPLEEVCGAMVTVAATGRTTATVAIDPEGTCSINVSAD